MTSLKLFTGTLLVLHLAALTSGASVSISGPVTIGASAHPRKVASSVKLPADFISVPVKLVSEQKEPAAAYQESRKAIDLIQQKAKERQNVRVVVGAADLSERQVGFGLSGGSFKQPAAVTVIHLLFPLTKEKNDIFLAGADAASFVESLRLPSKMTCHMGDIQLAIDNPEQYRSRLLSQIANEIASLRSALGHHGSVTVDGLQSPVMVRQLNGHEVEVYLNYSLSLTAESFKAR